jgi:hypothetical protein
VIYKSYLCIYYNLEDIMAITLSSSQSSILEPLRKNRWVMQFTTVPGSGTGPDKLAFCAHTCTRPTQTYNVTEYQRLNERFYMAGKVTWSELAMTFFDFMEGTNSVSSILYTWSNVIYNPVTGQMGFKKDYATSATLAMLDPAGGIVQTWNLFYIWPFTLTFGDLSADEDGLVEVAATFRYDFAIKGTDVASPAAAA